MTKVGRTLIAGALALLLIGPAAANETVIYVGGDKAKAAGGKWVKDLTRGFAAAAEAVNQPGARTVVVRVAAGDYTGDLGSGAYDLPLLNNPEGTLRVVGGWDAGFAARDPFGTPSRVVSPEGRSQPMWDLPKNCKLKGFVLDGMHFDAVGGNKYRDRALLVGQSCTFKLINWNMLETDLLQVESCTFLNSADRVMETLIRAATPQAEIRFRNNMFVNCRIPLKLDTARFRNKPAKIVVDRCSFILSWGYNPDPDSSNPAALELGPSDACGRFEVTNNLFYANFGGAILALNLKNSPMVISGNNFVGNGLLHGKAEPDAVAIIVAAGGKKQPLPLAKLEDVPFVEEAEGNVSVAPGIALSIGDVKPVDKDQVKASRGWQNDVNRILGRPLQGGTVKIGEYAPPQAWDPANPPFPAEDAAKRHGASPELVAR